MECFFSLSFSSVQFCLSGAFDQLNMKYFWKCTFHDERWTVQIKHIRNSTKVVIHLEYCNRVSVWAPDFLHYSVRCSRIIVHHSFAVQCFFSLNWSHKHTHSPSCNVCWCLKCIEWMHAHNCTSDCIDL